MTDTMPLSVPRRCLVLDVCREYLIFACEALAKDPPVVVGGAKPLRKACRIRLNSQVDQGIRCVAIIRSRAP